jgi:hypothetical protein
MLIELKKEYPKFAVFWNKILEQTKENKGEIYSGDNLSPLNVVRMFSSKLQSIKIEMQGYNYAYEKDPQATMPVKSHNDFMSILQKTIGKASDVYYGETEILDKNGKINNIL